MSEIASKPYADGIPMAIVTDVERPQAYRERRALWMAAGTTAALLVTLVVGFFLLTRSSRRLDAADAVLDSLIAEQLYQSYLSIGLLADAAESKDAGGKAVYTDAKAHQLLDTIVALLGRVDRQMDRLAESGSAGSLERYRRFSDLLRAQAGELRVYWRTGDRRRADQFQRTREQTWAIFKQMFESYE